MKKFLYAFPFLFLSLMATAQKKVQPLQPSKISVFKNGTYFIKREAVVELKDNVFYIPAPQNVLMGTWWLAASKETPIHSIVIKADTLKTEREASDLYGYLQANIGNDITLSGFSFNLSAGKEMTGKLLQFNSNTKMVKIAQPDGNIIVIRASDFKTFETKSKANSKFMADSIAGIAKVTVSKPAANISVSTISLESGIQWFPSYLFTPINDKEARLEMKAILTNDNTDITNTSVDIIIGNPEMFYGKQLDPASYNYFTQKIITPRYDNNVMQLNINTANTNAAWAENSDEDIEEAGEQKQGQKSGDLYYYQLGNIDLEKNAKVIVPVISNIVTFSELYTVNLDIHSASSEDKIADVYHNYRIRNSSAAPFTTGSIFVLHSDGKPFAQSRINYTPIKGTTEVRLAKAIDVLVKNTEEETKREKIASGNSYDDKITYKGNIRLTNYQVKNILIKITKRTEGIVIDNGTGKQRKTKNQRTLRDNTSVLEWEIEVRPGESIDLPYQYYSID